MFARDNTNATHLDICIIHAYSVYTKVFGRAHIPCLRSRPGVFSKYVVFFSRQFASHRWEEPLVYVPG